MLVAFLGNFKLLSFFSLFSSFALLSKDKGPDRCEAQLYEIKPSPLSS